jgi:hypothetical protein
VSAGDLEPNAVLIGGPGPIGGRHVYAEPDTIDYRATAGDGTGEYVWQRTSRFEARAGGGMLRVFAYMGAAGQPVEL